MFELSMLAWSHRQMVKAQAAESHARDTAWCARELGDVPHETITGWKSASGTRTPWFNDCIPIESLGRDA